MQAMNISGPENVIANDIIEMVITATWLPASEDPPVEDIGPGGRYFRPQLGLQRRGHGDGAALLRGLAQRLVEQRAEIT